MRSLSLPDVLFTNLIPELLDPGRVNWAALNIFITPFSFNVLKYKLTTENKIQRSTIPQPARTKEFAICVKIYILVFVKSRNQAPEGGGIMVMRFIVFILASAFCLSPAAVSAVGIGETAPMFTAASDKGEVNLGDYLGRSNVILSFYFAINTSA